MCSVQFVLLPTVDIYFWADVADTDNQGRIQKIFEGSSFGAEAHLPRSGLSRKRRSLGGSGGMPPEKFWKYGCSEVQFGAFLSRNRIATGLTISQATLARHIALLLHCTWLFSSPAGD